MPEIQRVTAREDFTLCIELTNNHKIIYDMSPSLKTVRFAKLANYTLFSACAVQDGSTIVWDNLCQITIDEIVNRLER